MVAHLQLYTETNYPPRDALSLFLKGINAEGRIRRNTKRKNSFLAFNGLFISGSDVVHQFDMLHHQAIMGFPPNLRMDFICDVDTHPARLPAPEPIKALLIRGALEWIKQTGSHTAFLLEDGKLGFIYHAQALWLIPDPLWWTQERLDLIEISYQFSTGNPMT